MARTYRKQRDRTHNSRKHKRKRYEKKMGLSNGVLVGWEPQARFRDKYISEEIR